jgi:hypothetical protein
LIHRGNADGGQVRDRYHDFINLPGVELAS